MVKPNKVQCDYKPELVLCDSFEIAIDNNPDNNVPVQVFLFRTKKSFKTYCNDTGLPFHLALKRL